MIVVAESHKAVVDRRRRLLHLCNGRSVTIITKHLSGKPPAGTNHAPQLVENSVAYRNLSPHNYTYLDCDES